MNLRAMFFALLTGLLGMTTLGAESPVSSVAAEAVVRKVTGVEYARVGETVLKLDLYLPQDSAPAGKARPLLIWIHGGGWTEGNRGFCPIAPLAQEGYVVASISYRLVKQGRFPAQIEDCKAAVRWLRGHAAEYGFDPERIGVVGESAGGQLAALLGTSGGVAELEGPGAAEAGAGVSSRVQAVVALCPPTNFLSTGDDTMLIAGLMASGKTEDVDRAKQILGRQFIMSNLFGGPVAERQDLARAASPVTHVSADDPPFLLVHGDRDWLVPYEQSTELRDALTAVGVPCELITVQGAGHGFGRLKAGLMAQVKAFLDGRLQ